MTDYLSILEEQNIQYLDRLTKLEKEVYSLRRKKGVYVVFTIHKVLVNKQWELHQKILSVCDKVDNILPVIRYYKNTTCKSYDKYGDEINSKSLVGFLYWRQSINYKWALSGYSKYVNLKFQRVSIINIDQETGNVKYV